MNRRTLKKKCSRAMSVLIAKHGYHAERFHAADGDETIDAPCRMEKRFVRHGFISPGVLKGTMLLWERTSYEYDEWDCTLPTEVLAEIEHWDSLTDADFRQLAGEILIDAA